MTRIPYDQAGKQLLDGALQSFGKVESQHELSAEPSWIDVWFTPDPARRGAAPPGLLGRMVQGACAFELFHTGPRVEQALACLAKQLGVQQRRRREARGGAVPRREAMPLWIVAATRPTAVLAQLAMQRRTGWPTGVYGMVAPALPLSLVIVQELPRTRDTLMLRLLGAGRVLVGALEELRKLPPHAWERRAAVGALSVLHSMAGRPAAWQHPDEEAIVVNVNELYEQIKNEGRREGVQQGMQQGLQEGMQQGVQQGMQRGVVAGKSDSILAVLRARGLEVSPMVAQRVRACRDLDQLDRWLEAALTVGSAEELLE